jgi:hypothetical protein
MEVECAQKSRKLILEDGMDGKELVPLASSENLMEEIVIESLDEPPSEFPPPHTNLQKKKGTVPFYVEFPEIIDEVKHLLCENGIAADKRRRKGQTEYFGTTLRMIQEHLLSVFPALKKEHPKLNVATIAHLFPPPRIGTTAAKHYYSLVEARPYHPDNCLRTESKMAHECAAMVKFFYELFALFSTKDTKMISADKKNLIIMGQDPCVSRYLKKRKYYLDGEKPVLNTHDFSHALKIAPYGYLDLKFRSGQAAGDYYFDFREKKHYEYPHSGQLFIYSHAASKPFKEKNIVLHYHHLTDMFKTSGAPSALLYVVDRGPDNDWESSFLNFLYYGKLFVEQKMDVLVVTGHAPGNDQFNFIERMWSPMTDCITGIILSDCLPNEHANPKLQKLSDADMREKLIKLYDLRLEELSSYWNNRMHDGFNVVARGIPPDKDWADNFNDGQWAQLCDVSLASKGSYSSEVEFANYLFQHCNRQSKFLSFVKCQNRDCTRCRSFGDDRSGRLIETIRNVFHGKFPVLELVGMLLISIFSLFSSLCSQC